ncbi:MAG TPA: hypothetical protein VKT50_12125 [Candidatus Acidoferrales bacterium]|nr:hypothetical protein [Candidatus Acidoferrales bacterium]
MKQPMFDDKEGAILIAMYEAGNHIYTSYTLASQLNPTVQRGTPPALAAFTETRETTERLIARGLVRGERLKGADGVYFNKLKLTTKGERAAIRYRETVKQAEIAAFELQETEKSKKTESP